VRQDDPGLGDVLIRRGAYVRASLLTAGLTAVLAVSVPVTAQSASSFDSFEAASEGVGVAFKVVYSGFASMFPIVDLGVAHVSGTLDSRPNARGYASAADPGQLLQSMGALGVPLPAYPLVARAEYPSATTHGHSSAAEQAVGPGTAQGLSSDVTAAAGPRLEASARAGSYEAEGVLVTGAVTTRTALSAVGTAVTSRIEATVKDVLIAGALRIGEVRTSVEAVAGGRPGSAKGTPSIEFSGVSVSGQAASIDDQGVHLAGQDVPGSAAGGAVSSATDSLAASGVSVRLGGVVSTASPDGSVAAASAEGLLISVTLPDGSVVAYRIGWAAASAGARLAEPVGSLPQEPSSPAFMGTSGPAISLQPVSAPPSPSAGPSTVQVQGRLVSRPVALPRNLVGLVALAQLVLWGTVAAVGFWARAEPAAEQREWLFDTIDRLKMANRR